MHKCAPLYLLFIPCLRNSHAHRNARSYTNTHSLISYTTTGSHAPCSAQAPLHHSDAGWLHRREHAHHNLWVGSSRWVGGSNVPDTGQLFHENMLVLVFEWALQVREWFIAKMQDILIHENIIIFEWALTSEGVVKCQDAGQFDPWEHAHHNLWVGSSRWGGGSNVPNTDQILSLRICASSLFERAPAGKGTWSSCSPYAIECEFGDVSREAAVALKVVPLVTIIKYCSPSSWVWIWWRVA